MATVTKKITVNASLVILLALALFLLCGCEEEVQKRPVDKGLINAAQVNMLNDIAMENAIKAQCTLYPYHFVKNSEQLNELGQRDLSVITEHLKKYPGQLNVQQGNTPLDIYQERVALVSHSLEDAGVDMTKVSIVDGMPGGDGMLSDDVVEIRQADRKARTDRREKYPVMSDWSIGQ
jgi:hypothetical protein